MLQLHNEHVLAFVDHFMAEMEHHNKTIHASHVWAWSNYDERY